MIGARTRCPWGENLCATSSTFAGRRHMIGKVVTGCVAILPYHTATQDRGSECRDFGSISRIVTALVMSFLKTGEGRQLDKISRTNFKRIIFTCNHLSSSVFQWQILAVHDVGVAECWDVKLKQTLDERRHRRHIITSLITSTQSSKVPLKRSLCHFMWTQVLCGKLGFFFCFHGCLS